MTRTPRDRRQLCDVIGAYFNLDTKTNGQFLAYLEAQGLRVVTAEPTQGMIEATGLEFLDGINEAIADAIDASPFAPEKPKP